jgi:hypothetical protein
MDREPEACEANATAMWVTVRDVNVMGVGPDGFRIIAGDLVLEA